MSFLTLHLSFTADGVNHKWSTTMVLDKCFIEMCSIVKCYVLVHSTIVHSRLLLQLDFNNLSFENFVVLNIDKLVDLSI